MIITGIALIFGMAWFFIGPKLGFEFESLGYWLVLLALGITLGVLNAISGLP